ncbi:uncharacterized protein LOC130450294 [Diorhabda sublineata]|uniref:uncharacterized protein LOC130450294 n=1 Tax=Diorhabda sublineata TaxID=1163346 RepID=UPI0024E10619|nr:uncharacterized protein LOC130450294 [Diorhabda sublineata]
MFKHFIIIFLLCTELYTARSDSVVDCPDQTKPGDKQLDYEIKGTINEKIHIVAPSVGFYDNKISCILISDLGHSSATPVIGPGGIGFNYVEVTITPGFLESLHYHIQIYTSQ